MENNKLDTLKKKREQIDARIKKMEAAEKTKRKKQDTRRKILIGAYALDQARQNGSESELFKNVLQYLNRDVDKKLFEGIINDVKQQEC